MKINVKRVFYKVETVLTLCLLQNLSYFLGLNFLNEIFLSLEFVTCRVSNIVIMSHKL